MRQPLRLAAALLTAILFVLLSPPVAQAADGPEDPDPGAPRHPAHARSSPV